MGNQVITGNRVRLNGNALHEWARRSPDSDQFGGRDVIDVGHTFGESFIYYNSSHPFTGTYQGKAGFLKRVVANGVPVLVGGGYYPQPDTAVSSRSCADNYVTARTVRTADDIEAFVRCAAEYVKEHGTEEARRAFNEDERWKSGPAYVFVDGVRGVGNGLDHVCLPAGPGPRGVAVGNVHR